MSFFKQISDQSRAAFTAMPMQSRVISVLLVGAIAVGLAFLVRGTAGESKEYLFAGRVFTEHELPSIEMAFGKAGLGDWELVGRRIKVPKASRATYLAALDDAPGIPITVRSSVQEALDSTGIFEPSDMRQMREMHGKELDLGRIIEQFPEVNNASVVYDRGERRGLNQVRPQSASVVVTPQGSAPLPSFRIHEIKELIRASYAGMHSDDVHVSDTNGTSSSAVDPAADPLLRKQKETEALVKEKVRGLLAGFPARVEVYAEIDPTMDTETTKLTYDSEPTNLSTRSRKVDTSTTKQLNRGIPGTGTNATITRSGSVDDNLQLTKSKEDEKESRGVTGQQYENSRIASLAVKSINVSVALPVSYYETVHTSEWLKQNPDGTAEDVPQLSVEALDQLRVDIQNKIESAVSILLPRVPPGEDPTSFVSVWDYNDPPELPPPDSETAKVALTWLADSWQTIALIVLALVALLVARSAAKGAGETPPSEFREGFGLELPKPAPPVVDHETNDDHMTITGGTLKEELVNIVEDNPEVAANVIRGWVQEAAA